MITFSEAKVLAPSIGSRRQLKFWITVKPEDINEENREGVWSAYADGKWIVAVLTFDMDWKKKNVILPSAKILSPTIGSHRQMKLSLVSEYVDVTQDSQDLLWNAYENGIPAYVVMEEFEGDPEEERRKSLLSQLHQEMQRFCELSGYDINDEKGRQKRRRNIIKSRTELTTSEIEEEIETYVNAIKASY